MANDTFTKEELDQAYGDAVAQTLPVSSEAKVNQLIAMAQKNKARYFQSGFVPAKGSRPDHYNFKVWPIGTERSRTSAASIR